MINTNDYEKLITNPVLDKISRVDRLFFASKIDHENVYPYLNSLKITTMIDFKDPSVNPLPEDELAKKYNINYERLVIHGVLDLTPDFLEKVNNVLEKDNGNILIYCNSANRVSAWLAVHLIKYEGLSADYAVEVAKRAGMDKEETEANLLAIIKSTYSK